MANTVYQLEFINRLGTKRENKVYSDLDNVIWYLEQEGFEYANAGENTYERTEYLDNHVAEKIKTLAVIHKVYYYENHMISKEHVYLKPTESDLKMELLDLLTDIVYEDKLTKEEKKDKKLEVTLKALELKEILKEER